MILKPDFKTKNLLKPLLTNSFTLKCLSTTISNSSQYIQESIIPTMHFQPSLPRLPIPKLNDTCERYLAVQQPLLSEEAIKQTEAHVNRFLNVEGKVLQSMLTAKDSNNKHTSYISSLWFDMYLKDRSSLPINYNPVMVFENDKRVEYNDQLLRATNMLISSLRFMKSLRKDILEPEVFHLNPRKSDTKMFRRVTSALPASVSWYGAYMYNAYPLDMSQYHNLFNSTRIPEIGKDCIYQDSNAKHVLVMHRGHFYTFDVLDNEGNILPASVLLARLKYILEEKVSPAACPLGILTTENRDIWATERKHLLSLGNENFFRMIDSALFNLVLDDEIVGEDPYKMTKHFLHGDGTNRWFDKSFSLLLSKDGVAAINFEHSWGDGVAVLRYLQDIYTDTKDNPQVHPNTEISSFNNALGEVQKLSIKIDDRVKENIDLAIKKYHAKYSSLEVNYILTDGIGKKLCKKQAVSPDAVMQLGFQAAFYKQANRFVPSYESCSTAAFKHGRTETIRPCTIETKVYCQTVKNSNHVSNDQLQTLIRNCSVKHGKLTKEAAMGQGFDRHMYALKRIAEENGDTSLPALFEDPAYHALNNNIISTSTLSSPAVQAGGFGPVVTDGYGIAYIIRDDSLGALVTNYAGQQDGAHFIHCLKYAYEQIRDILIKSNSS